MSEELGNGFKKKRNGADAFGNGRKLFLLDKKSNAFSVENEVFENLKKTHTSIFGIIFGHGEITKLIYHVHLFNHQRRRGILQVRLNFFLQKK